ncbi:MFS transporter [Leucobacter tenebrionis]|uniref:MFS transporter n=1 Tax=Leucobacter tenebrionis TaxID=2873270 RepID=UPI001CA79F50|nr:MFS transporter [Leucobacter tenebrionis]QZY50625.1 MFS transporter [Leucobacter tenebrionis]
MTHTDAQRLTGTRGSSGDPRLTPRQWVAFLLIALVLLADGMDVTIVSHIFPSLIEQWGVSIGGGIAALVSAGFIAMGVGALVAGRAADRWGRKPVLVTTTLLFGAGTALGASSTDFASFSAWRLLACLGMGAAMATGNTLLADLMPPRRRSAMLATAYAFVGLGTTVGATLAAVIIPTAGWEGLLIAGGAIPLVIAVVLALVVPEAPPFLVARGDLERAARAAARLDPRSVGALLEGAAQPRGTADHGAWRQLFSRRFAPRTILLWAFGFFSLGTQLMVVQYLPTMLQLPEPGLDTVQSSTIVGAYGFTSVLGGLLLGVVLVRASRFATIGIALALTAMAVLVIGLAPSPGYGALLALLSVTGFLLPSACGPTRSVLAAAAYPTDVRGTGVGSTEFSGRLGSAAGGAAGGALIGAGLGLSGFFSALLVPVFILLALLAGLRAVSRHSDSAVEPQPAGAAA